MTTTLDPNPFEPQDIPDTTLEMIPDTKPTPPRDGLPESNDPPSEKQVPVSEAIRYRKRAQTAEQQLGELRDRFTQLQAQLDSSQETITSLERRQKIDAMRIDIKKRRECRSTSRRLPAANNCSLRH